MFRWVARGGASQPVQPADPVEPVKPAQPSGGSGDDTWNGRKLRLVVDDSFDGQLDKSVWENEVSLWGGGVSAFDIINTKLLCFTSLKLARL